MQFHPAEKTGLRRSEQNMNAIFGTPQPLDGLDEAALRTNARILARHLDFGERVLKGRPLPVRLSRHLRTEGESAMYNTHVALKKACCLPPGKRQKFFAGFARGLKQETVGGDGRLLTDTTASPVKIFILRNCSRVRRCRNTPALLQLLTRELGPNVAGHIGRVEKICQRMG